VITRDEFTAVLTEALETFKAAILAEVTEIKQASAERTSKSAADAAALTGALEKALDRISALEKTSAALSKRSVLKQSLEGQEGSITRRPESAVATALRHGHVELT